MIHQPGYMKELLRKYMEGSATPGERNRLMAAWDLYDDNEISEMIAELTDAFRDADIDTPYFKSPVKDVSFKSSMLHWLSSASGRAITLALGILLVALLFFLLPNVIRPGQQQLYCNETTASGKLPAGSFSCTITLADNRRIVLDSSSHTGVIAHQGNIEIVQPEPGVIEYKMAGSLTGEDTAVMYNILQTSPGQQYQVKLPDGSRVKLNAASVIKFPVSFKDTRVLMLSGEALFDVAHVGNKPFYVKTRNAEMMAKEANFNVKSYPPGNTVATVLTGKLEVNSTAASARPGAGKQAIVYRLSNQERDTIMVRRTNAAAAVSWQKQIRIYNDVSMREFVSDMGRWYNLEIVSLGCVPENARISISICYNTPLENVVQIFREQRLLFKKEGTKITFCDPGGM